MIIILLQTGAVRPFFIFSPKIVRILMPLFNNLAALLRAPVGNNHENRPDDVINMKQNLAKTGHYKRPIENGYIDQELDDGIKNFQRAKKLKVDGIAKPGGETEATLASTLMKLPNPKPSKDDEKYGYQTASAVPLFKILGMGLGMSAAGAAQWWMNENNADDREQILQLFQNKQEEDTNTPDSNDPCMQEYYRDIDDCKEVGQRLNHRAEKGCQETAAIRLSQCLKGTPDKDRRLLQKLF